MKTCNILLVAICAIALSGFGGNGSVSQKSKHDFKHEVVNQHPANLEFNDVTSFVFGRDFIAPVALKIVDLNFEVPVPPVIGVPDTKRHDAWRFETVQKKC